jgi:hypothetical protein
MTSEFPKLARDAQQFAVQLSSIRERCPDFVAWIRKSVEETIVAVCGSKDETLLRQTGALMDLRTILGAIENPPQLPLQENPAKGTGMGIL